MGDRSQSTAVPYRPSPLPSAHHEVAVKQESQPGELMPPPRSEIERFVPYAAYLSQNAGSTSIARHKAPATSSTHATPVPKLPLPHLNELATTVAGSLSVQEPQHALSGMDPRPVETNTGHKIAPATHKQRSPYSWANEYNKKYAKDLAIIIEVRHLKKTNRGNIAKLLEAAKETMLELLTDEEMDKLNLDKVPAHWTRLKKIARQLDVLIPHEFIPMGPGLLAMDRMLCATKSYIHHLRARLSTAGIYNAQETPQTEPGGIPNQGPEPDDEAFKADLKRKKRLRKKERRKKAKREAQAIESKEKRESQHDSDEEVVTQPPKAKKQNSTALPIEEDISHSELEAPQPIKTKKQKKVALSLEESTTEAAPDKAKSKKQKRPLLTMEYGTPEARPEKQKSKAKKRAIPDENEISDIGSVKPKAKKHKKAKRSTSPIDDTAATVPPNTTFDLESSFVGETLKATEDRADRLADEVRNLKAILHAVGVTAGSVSVGLTRMRHGQSAEDIFSGVKREGRED